MAYTTTTEIQNLTARTFSDSPATLITLTQMGVMVTAWSGKLDGLAGVDVDTYGDDTTCPQWVKSAVQAAVLMIIENVYVDEINHTEKQILETMQRFIQKRHTDTNLQPSFSSNQPDEQGKV